MPGEDGQGQDPHTDPQSLRLGSLLEVLTCRFRRWGAQHADAEDLAMECLLKLLSKIHRGKVGGSMEALTHLVARDAWCERIRQVTRKPWQSTAGPDPADCPVAPTAPSSNEADVKRLLHKKLHELAPGLLESEKRLAELWLIEGRSMSECSRILKCGLASAYRVRKKITTLLAAVVDNS